MPTGTSFRTSGTLPLQMSGFVGRAAELARVRELLRASRLVTVTGPGGVGKTRLAVHAAREAAKDFRDGARLIELSAVCDPGQLAHAIAKGLAVAGLPGSAPGSGSHPGPDPGSRARLDGLLGLICADIRERELLLILDTCEHLIDACAAVADTMLREVPGVTILATSRQRLDAAGEAILQLSPLPVPEPGAATPGKADAVELFAQRAAAAVPGFSVTPENVADIVTICRRLDGIPLAIELAAVRVRALPLPSLAEHIDDMLRLLTSGRRSEPPRHQTLRAAIEWSYALCTPTEQLLWARLSVFADGFGLAAAEEVCAGYGLAGEAVEPALVSLVNKNVLCADTPDRRPREGCRPAEPGFLMLAAIRQFGAEQLRLSDTRVVVPWRRDRAEPPRHEPARHKPAPHEPARHEPARHEPEGTVHAEAAVRRRFIAHYLTLAERFEREAATDQLGQYQRLRREHANLRAAFGYALDLPGNDGAAIVLATSLFVYWQISGQVQEAEYWLDQVAPRCPNGSVVLARVLAARGYVRALLGDYANGRADAEAAIAAAAPFTDLASRGRAYSALHRMFAYGGYLAEAQEAARTAADCLTSTADTLGLAQLDIVDAMVRLQAGEPGLCYQEATRGLARLPADELWCTSQLYGLQALSLLLLGQPERATPPGRLALAMKHRMNDVTGMAFGLGALAFIAAAEGRYERTAWLFGAAAPLWESTGCWYGRAPAFRALHQVAERAARNGLGDDRFNAVYEAGATAPLDRVIERALADDQASDDRASDDQTGKLAG